MCKTLALLLEAHEQALDLRQKEWELAVELAALMEVGATHTALRWLLCMDYATHAVEQTRPQAKARSFRRRTNLSFATKSCFLLSPSGIAFARQFFEDSAHPQLNGMHVIAPPEKALIIPHWSRDELRLDGVLIKALAQAAPNQKAILTSFQEDDWVPQIDNPIPPVAGKENNQRLHDTLRRLNRKQEHPLMLIRFRSIHRGEAIRWELIPKVEPERP
jgi:hypothetical protein